MDYVEAGGGGAEMGAMWGCERRGKGSDALGMRTTERAWDL